MAMKIKDTSLTPREIMKVYEAFISKANRLYSQDKLNKCIEYIMLAARWMYKFNIIYYDEVIENLIHTISNTLFKKTKTYVPDNDCIVFLDSICTTRCLGVQYLSGLMALNKKIIYILHQHVSESKDVLAFLENYENKEIYIIDTKYSYVKQSERINQIIEENKPSDIFLHMRPHDVVSLVSIANIKTLKKYNIDLQDHTYWLGRSFIDFDIVFRHYGEKIAKEKRNLTDTEIIRLPYYPLIHQNSEFKGFPSELPRNAVIIFTGGSPYKMLGKDDIFFKILDNILNISANIHILLATNDSDVIKQKISQRKDKDRIHLIGHRKDIDQVFKHSHIYLSTYPFIGGLMSQYAAASGLPILAYAEENEPNVVEGLINHKCIGVTTQRNLTAFTEYAKHLIIDSDFRKSEGERNKEALYTLPDFIFDLNSLLQNQKTSRKWLYKENPDYEKMIKFYIDNENKYGHSALIYSIMTLKFKVFSFFPSETITILQLMIRGTYKKLFKKLGLRH